MYAEIRAGMKALLVASKLFAEVYEYIPKVPTVPAAVLCLGEGDYGQSIGEAAWPKWKLQLFLSTNDWKESQIKMDKWLDPTQATFIGTILNGEHTWTSVYNVQVLKIGAPAIMVLPGGSEFLGVDVELEIVP
jgi:hypothetical protein